MMKKDKFSPTDSQKDKIKDLINSAKEKLSSMDHVGYNITCISQAKGGDNEQRFILVHQSSGHEVELISFYGSDDMRNFLWDEISKIKG